MCSMQAEISKITSTIENYTAATIDGKKKFSVLAKQLTKLHDEHKSLKDEQARVF